MNSESAYPLRATENPLSLMKSVVK